MKKIYIIGPVGSGKTTFSKKLSEKCNITRYELDKVSWDDDNGNIKRTDEDVLKLFDEILDNDSWIIEDVGRTKFKKGREEADIIYYIKLSKLKSRYRVIKRWIKQRIGIEVYNHPPTFKQLLYFLSTVKSYYKKEKNKLKELEKFQDKLVFLSNKKIKEILYDKK
ncbi:MAG: DNA topology modulation protein FlaR [Bacilli bacterium]|nr:DNA topology modulation protein FlaR [Bacilli bacterium]